MRREGLKVRLLPARQAEAENERNCCNAVNGASDVGVVLGVVVGVMDVVVVVVVVVLRRERMADENGRLD